MSHPAVDEIIVDTKRECDFIFIYVHAGYENESYPLPELRTLYRHFINMGADGVFASHPHVPQPWENYKNKIIAYSLGNFCFDNPSVNNDLWYWSLVMSLEIKNDGSLKVTPHFCYFNSHFFNFVLFESLLFSSTFVFINFTKLFMSIICFISLSFLPIAFSGCAFVDFNK